MSSEIGDTCRKNNQQDGSATETCVVDKAAKMPIANGKCSKSTYSCVVGIINLLFEIGAAVLWYVGYTFYCFYVLLNFISRM